MKLSHLVVFSIIATAGGMLCAASPKPTPTQQPYLCNVLCAVAKLPERVPSTVSHAVMCLKEQKNISVNELMQALDDCDTILEKYHGKIKRDEDVACLHDQLEQYRATFEYITTAPDLDVNNEAIVDSIIDDLVTRGACKCKSYSKLIVNDCLKVKRKLLVCGNAEFGSNVDIAGNLNVGGDTTIGGDLLVEGSETILGDLIVENTIFTDTLIAEIIITTTLIAEVIVTDTLIVEGTITASGLNICECTLFVDCPDNQVGINTCTPDAELHVIGETIITGSLTVGTATLYFDANKNRLGVNTLTPRVDLDVIGSATISGRLDVGENLSVDTNVLFVNAATNRVGINTSSPLVALDVVGSATVRGDIEFQPNSTLPFLHTIGAQFVPGLRVVTGVVNTSLAGAPVVRGSGFTFERVALGRGTIVFNQAYDTATGLPMISLTGDNSTSSDQDLITTVTFVTATLVGIVCATDAGADVGQNVHFIAIGPND